MEENNSSNSAEINLDSIKGNSINLDGVNLYEELKEKNEIDPDDDSKESAAKNLSLRLLATQNPIEILNIFENEIIRRPDRKMHAEQLCMVLKFL